MPRTTGGYLFHHIGVGQQGRTLMPHSEVCIHMRVAGKYMDFEVQERSIQLFVTDDSTPRYSQHFSSSITMGEAGMKDTTEPRCGMAPYYYLPHGLQLHDDPLATEPPRTPAKELSETSTISEKP